jgi:hypothetical protein
VSSQRAVRTSIRFMPDASAESVGASTPRSSDERKALTRAIRAVAA